MFAELVPNEPMPEAMLAAERRFQQYSAQVAADPGALPDIGEWGAQDIASVPHFRQQPLQADGIELRWQWHPGNPCNFSNCSGFASCGIHVTADRSYRRDDVHRFQGQVCAIIGSYVRYRITYRTWWSWSTVADFTVETPNYIYIYHSQDPLDFDVSSLIYDTGPDVYSYRQQGW
jgi:hypothetical protein